MVSQELTNFVQNTKARAQQVNNNENSILRAIGLNRIAMLKDRIVTLPADGGEFADAYVDADGQQNSVDTSETSAVFDTDKYKAITSSTEPFIIIEASSLTTSDFEINDCKCITIESGKWQLTCTTGTDEEKRAKIYKTLFVGTTPTGTTSYITSNVNPRVTSTYITGLTALKTNISDDVGKQAYYYHVRANCPYSTYADARGYYSLTFDDTTSNTDCNSWSYVQAYKSFTTGGYAKWEIPTGTVRNKVSGTSDGVTVSDETGTDRTSDTVSNPTNALLDANPADTNDNYSANAVASALILCKGDIAAVFTDSTTGTGSVTSGEWDYTNDYSVPVFSLATEDLVSQIFHTIPSGTFSSTISSAFLTIDPEDWEDGANVQYKLTNTGGDDTGWLDFNDKKNFTAFTAEPENFIYKLIHKTTSPTAGTPSSTGYYLQGDRP